MDHVATVMNYREQLPWLRLFRAFSIAIDMRQIILAVMALVTLSAGNALISRLPFAPGDEPLAWDATLQSIQSQFGEALPLETARQIGTAPWPRLVEIFADGALILSPLRSIIDPAVVLFQTGSTWPEVAYAWTQLLLALCVWSVFGGAITRLAATHFACDERVGVSGAIHFSAPRFLSYMAAPLLPIAGLGFFWLVCVVGGLIGRIPAVGNLVVGVLWIIPLVCSLLMALMLVGLTVGWPLMFAAISAEGSDGFDGLSRAYSYVYNRPWYYLFLVILAIVYGSAAVFVVWLIACLLVHLSEWSVAAGMGAEAVNNLFRACPTFLRRAEVIGGPEVDTGVIVAAAAVGIWLRIVALATIGFLYSYFWTAMTIVYFLLRKSDDDTDLDEVFLPREDEPSMAEPTTTETPASESDSTPDAASEESPAKPQEQESSADTPPAGSAPDDSGEAANSTNGDEGKDAS